MRVLVVVLVLLAPQLAPTSVGAISALEARGPDADGAYILSYALTADGPMRLDVFHDGNHTTRDLGTRRAEGRIDVSFLPAEGAGEYAVRLVAVDETSDALAFTVAEGDGATRDVAIQVPDSPTTLELANDSVNADGKTKSPGEELITRAHLADANGVGAIRVRFLVDGRDEGDVAFAAPENATRALIELRFARTPISAGAHRLTLAAGNATATRTFVIRDAPATLENATLDPILPDENHTRSLDVDLVDKNGFDHPLEARIYRAATRVDVPLALTLTPDGARARLRVDLAVPQGFPAGNYRLSIYDHGTLAGSARFDVLTLPAIASIQTVAEGDGVRLFVNGTGNGFVNDAPFVDGRASFHSANVTNATWSLALRARQDGPVLEVRNASWNAARLVLEPAGRNAWRLAAEGFDLALADASVALTRWDGREVDARAVFDGATLRFGALEAGRYDATATMRMPNGATLRASWSFESAPWLRLAMGEAIVNGSHASIDITNAGGVPIRRLVIEAENLTLVSLDATPGARSFDVDLPPGASVTLVVRLPDGAHAPGAHAGRVRAFALAAGP